MSLLTSILFFSLSMCGPSPESIFSKHIFTTLDRLFRFAGCGDSYNSHLISWNGDWEKIIQIKTYDSGSILLIWSGATHYFASYWWYQTCFPVSSECLTIERLVLGRCWSRTNSSHEFWLNVGWNCFLLFENSTSSFYNIIHGTHFACIRKSYSLETRAENNNLSTVYFNWNWNFRGVSTYK